MSTATYNPTAAATTPPFYDPNAASNTTDKKPRISDTPKLAAFLGECLVVGNLRGFKHFDLYLRGKEELLMRVCLPGGGGGGNVGESSMSELAVGIDRRPTTAAATAAAHSSADDLAKAVAKLMLAKRSRTLLIEETAEAVPASPCDRELERDSNTSAFLIAGYARYKRPYVWLRSNHARLVKADEEHPVDADNPVKLDTVARWPDADVNLWEVITEILNMILVPAVANPFAIDHEYLNRLSLEGSVILSAALVDFFLKVLMKRPPFAEHCK